MALLRGDDLLRVRRVVSPRPAGRCEVDGQVLLDFASNDYLGLACDARLIAAAHAALEESGTGARASALVTGRTRWHAALEERLSQFEGAEAALLFPTGYAANLGAVTALVGPGDTVFCDRLNHASLVDGCRLSGARLRVYPHRDLDRLTSLLHRAAAGRRLIVTDSVFSMDGDIAPLVELCDLADEQQAMLLVDEAHGTGVFGNNGRGVCELADVEARVTVRVGTLSKAAGVQGGFVVGSRLLVEWLWNRARPQMFSTALSPVLCAAALAAVDLIEAEADRRRHLGHLGELFRSQLEDAGLRPGGERAGPIVPLRLRSVTETLAVSRSLQDQGFLVPAIRPPTVPRGTARLRISLSAAHTQDDVRALAEALASCIRSDG